MMISTVFCPVCGAANDGGSTHCFACGQLLASAGNNAQAQDKILFERYQLITLLGSGGFSAVYRARDLREGGREVAIKQIALQGLSAEETIDATTTFNREVATLSALKHPQIPRIYDHFSDRDHWYLVLEYIPGQTLETYLAPRVAQGKLLQMDEILDVGLQLCTVLEYLHSQQPPVIYRDLKPSNIMRTPSGKLVLIDFGIARQFTPGQKRDTQPLGSPGYAAPEQYGRGQTDARADIYSLGALLHYLLTGQDPADHLLSLPPLHLNGQPGGPELETLLALMLANDPADRPASARAAADTLNQIKQLTSLRDAARIWIPPTPQNYPTPAGQQQLQFQHSQPAQPARRKRPTRRRVLVGMGILAVVAGTGALWWESQTWKSLSASSPVFTYRGHQGPVQSVAWSPNGTRIASASADITVQVWNANDGSNALTYRGHAAPVNSVCWSLDGQLIASGSSDGTLQVWNASNVEPIYERGLTSAVDTVAWSPEDLYTAYLATVSDGGPVQVWDAFSGEDAVSLGQGEALSTVAWSPDGTQIASGGVSGVVMVWSALNWKNIATYRKHTGAIQSVAWSPDKLLLASASADGSTRIWNVNTWTNGVTHLNPGATVNTVAWSPDSKRLATGSSDGTVEVWNASDGTTVYTYTGHSAAVNSIAWSPDGKLIASASDDQTVQVWSAPS